jgi:hypothetical protein
VKEPNSEALQLDGGYGLEGVRGIDRAAAQDERGRKAGMRAKTSAMLMALAEENVRKLYPAASEREIFLRSAARRLDRETMIRAYGWDPLEAGK